MKAIETRYLGPTNTRGSHAKGKTMQMRIISRKEAEYIMGAARVASGYVLTHEAAPRITNPHCSECHLAKLPDNWTQGRPVTRAQASAMVAELDSHTTQVGKPGVMGRIGAAAAECAAICRDDLQALLTPRHETHQNQQRL